MTDAALRYVWLVLASMFVIAALVLAAAGALLAVLDRREQRQFHEAMRGIDTYEQFCAAIEREQQ